MVNWLTVVPAVVALWTGCMVSAAADVRDKQLSAWMQVYDQALTDYNQGHFARAHEDFLQLADFGSAAAQTILGYMYLQGQGVKSSAPIAATWFMKAANRGYAPAQTALAHLYESGNGVFQSYPSAILWYSIVSRRARGDMVRVAVNGLTRLRQRVPIATFVRYQDLAEHWQPSLPLLPQ